MLSKHLLKVVVVWLSFNLSLSEEPSFPYPKEDNNFFNNQFIIEFQRNEKGEKAKQMLSNGMKNGDDDSINVIRRIDARNIYVAKFNSDLAVEKWRNQAINKGVKYFERDARVYLQEVLPSKQGTTRNLAESTPIGITDVRAQDVLDVNSSSRKVCIIDSGYDKSHEDLPDDPTIVTGKSFVENDEAWYTDEIGHGTHVAGTIVALGGNNIGIKGLIRNGELRLHIVKVFGPSFGPTSSVIIAAIEECVAEGSNVINMSFGGKGRLDSYQDAIKAAHEKGILMFASTGNIGSSDYMYPASYDHVTSVASVDSDYRHIPFSNYNDKVDISAPGENVLSTVPGNGYVSYSGTSMSCPHASGVAALVWSNCPTLPAEVLRTMLESTATDLPLNADDGKDDKYGYGLINAEAAYDAVVDYLDDTNDCNTEGKKMCNQVDGCYWFPNEKQCYACSRISEDLDRGKNFCKRFGCTWNGSSCE